MPKPRKEEKKSEPKAAPKPKAKLSVQRMAKTLLSTMPESPKDPAGPFWIGKVEEFVAVTKPLRKGAKGPKIEALAEIAGVPRRGCSTSGLAMAKHALEVLAE